MLVSARPRLTSKRCGPCVVASSSLPAPPAAAAAVAAVDEVSALLRRLVESRRSKENNERGKDDSRRNLCRAPADADDDDVDAPVGCVWRHSSLSFVDETTQLELARRPLDHVVVVSSS